MFRKSLTSISSSTGRAVALGPVLLALLACLVTPASSSALALPLPDFEPPNIRPIVKLARIEMTKRVSERKSNNVPRYRNGKGRIAPYSIGDQWCVAFTTWVWSRAGFDDYTGAGLLRSSHDRTIVAVQVADMTRWAKRYGYFSYRAIPGFAVVYGSRHMGIVRKVDREGRAVLSIEGNKSDRVRPVKVPMAEVTGYISPFRIFPAQAIPRNSKYADVD
jgi:hypothetical protein